ncbi:pyocin knob domain-containing protein [Lactiplantibacillus plantarum]|uniref:pyocin knob domain-containing protein n=1 Tax=Lactiplantibacillus plantarum TaxID=1590 RepID=UPI0020A556E2|nr:pyocin knob domain-containing protein [Lactiplantibacillus plantarum]MCG0783390.1 collagen-like protein [Lactiplantibacillus plantarum]
MAKTLSFTDTSPQTVKIGDTTTSFTLVCGNDNVATDLTKVTSITVKLGNASGYLKSATVDPAKLTDPTTGQVTVKFNADLMTSLPAGSYAIEVWVVDSTGTSIYPSDGSTGFTITNNIQSANGSVITTITFDDFVEAMNKAASTIAKGDKGSSIWAMKIIAGGNLLGRWFTDLYNASATNLPAVNDLVVQPDGNVFSVINVDTNNGAAYDGGGTFDIGPTIYSIKGDKGDTPDLSNYTTVADLNNGLSTKVTDNKDNTITANRVNYDLSKTSITPIGLIASGSFNDLPLGTVFANASAMTDGPNSVNSFTTTTFYFSQWNGRKVQIAITDNVNLMYFRVYTGTVWTSWTLLSDNSTVVHKSGANNFDTIPTYGTGNKPFAINDTGATTDRPTGQAAGYQYFDTSLNKPIWYTGKNWVDATGATV